MCGPGPVRTHVFLTVTRTWYDTIKEKMFEDKAVVPKKSLKYREVLSDPPTT